MTPNIHAIIRQHVSLDVRCNASCRNRIPFESLDNGFLSR